MIAYDTCVIGSSEPDIEATALVLCVSFPDTDFPIPISNERLWSFSLSCILVERNRDKLKPLVGFAANRSLLTARANLLTLAIPLSTATLGHVKFNLLQQ